MHTHSDRESHAWVLFVFELNGTVVGQGLFIYLGNRKSLTALITNITFH